MTMALDTVGTDSHHETTFSVSEEQPVSGDSLALNEALLRLSVNTAGFTTLNDLLRQLPTSLRDAVPFDHLGLMLHDQERDVMRVALVHPELPLPMRETPVDFGPAGVILRSQHTMVIHLDTEEPLTGMMPSLRDLGFRVMCGVPLTTARVRLGVLIFGSRDAINYNPDAVALMEQIAGQVALAVEHAVQLERLEALGASLAAERDRVRLLLDVNNLLVSELDYPSVLGKISQALRDVIQHDYASIALYDAESEQMQLHALTFTDERGVRPADHFLPLDNSPAGIAYQRGVVTMFGEADLAAFGPAGAPTLLTERIKSICCVPLVTRRSKLGVISVASRSPDAFSPDDAALLGQLSSQIAIAVENARAYGEIAGIKDQLAEEKDYLQDEIRLAHDFSEIIGESATLKRVLQAIETVAPTDSTVLLLGETGTGKELLARALHNLSRRRDRTFVRVNGAALPANLVESELFGYEKGAFTGASMNKVGRLELAHRGTLFLDEIGDLPLDVQPKLLRALQEREFERLGSTRTLRVDLRLIAATNRDLDAMVAEGRFRSDLFYRLNVFPIHVPALRDRREDIPSLVHHFVGKFAREMNRSIRSIPADTMAALERWDWPGNIRELENVIERAVILSNGPVLQVPSAAIHPPRARHAGSRETPRPPRLRDAEREAIVRALRESNGVVAGPAGAAARLGVKRTTLQSKMRKLGITRPGY
jgi:formate hydrogenlyase transcriptional activator